MTIKEGSIITILSLNDVIINKITAIEDIEIENNGNGYSFLLRHEGCEENCIFESDRIYKKDNEFFIEGFFKDAILVLEDKKNKTMYDSYMEYDN